MKESTNILLKSPDVIFGETERAKWVPMVVSVKTGTSTLQPITDNEGVKSEAKVTIPLFTLYIFHVGMYFLQNASF